MKRPILIAVIGYILGIIVGLYFKHSIVLLYIPTIAIYLIRKRYTQKERRTKKLKLFSIKRYSRYSKIFFNSKVIFIIIICSTISNTIVMFQNRNYELIFNNLSELEDVQLTGVIISDKEEKQYYDKYKIQTKYKGQKINFYISVNKNINLEYGDQIKILGQYSKPEIQRNYKGFDYSEYLKQLKIYGTIKCKTVEVIAKEKANFWFQISNKISNNIKQNIKKLMKEEYSSILIGLILGDKSDIDEYIQENFRNASLSHILAVSGMHVAYVIMGVNLVLKIILGKRKTYIISIFVLILYMFITDFSPSISRAGIMGIIMLISKIIYKKNDIWTSLSISLLIILIYNPFLLENLGLQLSYGGVIGIIVFNKEILQILKNINIKNKIYKYRIKPKIQKALDNVKEILSISISVQIVIFPIIVYQLNTFNPFFLLSNLLVSFIIGPTVILGFLIITIANININVSNVISPFLELLLEILLKISKISELQYSKIYIQTPQFLMVIAYFFLIIILIQIYKIYSSKNPNRTQIRIRNIIAFMKYKTRLNINRCKQILAGILLLFLIINFIPKDLKIHFIDVGQGDSTLIVTPTKKTILIDGGGSIDFDVGKKTLIPYILDRGFSKIDMVIISHFDNDHVRSDCLQ